MERRVHLVGGGEDPCANDGMVTYHGNERYLEEYDHWLTKSLKNTFYSHAIMGVFNAWELLVNLRKAKWELTIMCNYMKMHNNGWVKPPK